MLLPVSTWIFLRGWAREARHWGDFPAQFSAVMPDAEIVELDPPGGGRFYAQRSLLTVESMVEHAREWLRARSTPAPYHLLGLSLGGMVSLDWASRHPGRDRGLRRAEHEPAALRPGVRADMGLYSNA